MIGLEVAAGIFFVITKLASLPRCVGTTPDSGEVLRLAVHPSHGGARCRLHFLTVALLKRRRNDGAS